MSRKQKMGKVLQFDTPKEKEEPEESISIKLDEKALKVVMTFSWADTAVCMDGDEAANLIILLAQKVEQLSKLQGGTTDGH